MGFLSIASALYDYHPQSDEELELKEGELLYILEKDGGDDWWRARKKAATEDEDEPEGLIPNNYVEDAKPISRAVALYDYTRQTDEEVSFSEDAALEVFDTSDPDWTLVGSNGEFGFAPANYIELSDEPVVVEPSGAAAPPQPPRPSIPLADEPERPPTPTSPAREAPVSATGPAADLARVLHGGAVSSPTSTRPISSPPVEPQQPTPDPSDEEQAPALPRRPPSTSISVPPPALPNTARPRDTGPEDDEPPGVLASPPHNRATHFPQETDASAMRSPGGYRLYHVSEMVSVMGRRKKMPTTLGLNLAHGTIMLAPEKMKDGPTQEWTADKLNHYSIEGKHVFLELVRPSKSLDLHAGSKDTASEIVALLGEIAGAQRAAGFDEVMQAAAGTGSQKKGKALYDHMALADDEVTVAAGDELLVIDDEKSADWWQVRRVKNGEEGMVPSSYVELIGFVSAEPASRAGVNAGLSTIEQNRKEEERLAKEAAMATRAEREAEEARERKQKAQIKPPERDSSLTEDDRRKSSRREKRSTTKTDKARDKPDPLKTRTWTDHSGSFKVDAQFIGIADGKIHLHKVNGVKIAVPVAKMSQADLDYVEKVMNEPIEDHIPVADLIKLKRKSQAMESTSRSGASIGKDLPNGPEYDWFDFFLIAGVGPHQCERYAQAFAKDAMDESILPDISAATLRTLGIKEGDALKIMKHLDQRFGRNRVNGTESGQGGLFTGPGGALINNTGRARPEVKRQASDVVDASAFDQSSGKTTPAQSSQTSQAGIPSHGQQNGFDDNAWEVKPSSKTSAPVASSVTPPPAATSAADPVSPKQPSVSANMQALSLLDQPLVPTPATISKPTKTSPAQLPVQASTSPPPQQQTQQSGATTAFFSQVQQAQLQGQATAAQQILQPPRQRHQAPQQYTGSALLPPPPRPQSAPQNPQQNQFVAIPITPQFTGMPMTARPTGPGQSLDEITAQKLQQQYLQAQATGYAPVPHYGQLAGGFMPQATGFPSQMTQPSYLTGNVNGSPFADSAAFRPQPTGYGLQPGPAPGSLNAILPPALTPQRTGFQSPPQPQTNGFGQGIQSQPTGFQSMQPQMTGYQQPVQPQPTGFSSFPQQNGFGTQLPPVPPLPQQSPAPLMPQKTGPAPNVKFGVSDAKKLQAQPTGRRANLANASAANPFGF